MSFLSVTSLLFYACTIVLADVATTTTYCVTDTDVDNITFCYNIPLGWITNTYTLSAETRTESVYTETDPATTVTYADSTTFPGYTDTSPWLMTTYTATTFTYPAETDTIPPITTTTLVPPLLLDGVLPIDVLLLLHDVNPSITTIGDDTV